MKKQKITSLRLNKKAVSSFKLTYIVGAGGSNQTNCRWCVTNRHNNNCES